MQREIEYEGTVKKCPNCGAVLGSADLNCPECGLEIRNIKASSAITEFCSRLNEMSDTDKPTFISSFPIPNTKEDFLEFLYLVSAQYSEATYVSLGSTEHLILKAWASKYKQLQARAPIVFRKDKDTLNEINQIFKSTKKPFPMALKILISLMLFMVVLVLSLVLPNTLKISSETKRLEAIYAEALAEIENGNYAVSELKVNQLIWSVNTDSWDNNKTGKAQSDAWNKKREMLLKTIKEKKK